MAVNFPNTPTLNEEFSAGDRTWLWNGVYWEAISTTVGYTGSQGDLGFTGSAGTSGVDGTDGAVGFTGSAGAGFTGSQGEVGFVGSQGNLGYTGSAGIDGVIGRDGYTGSLGYTGSQGVGFTGSAGAGFTGSASTAVGYTGSQGVGFTGSVGGFESVQVLNTQSGTTYSLILSDAGDLVSLTNAAGCTVTIPPDSSVNFGIGQRIDIGQFSVGTVVIAPAAGVTLYSTDSPTLVSQYSIGTLIKIGNNEWTFAGPATNQVGYTGSAGAGFTGSVGPAGPPGVTPFVVAVTNEVGSVIVGTARVTFRSPFALTLNAIPRASLTTVSSSGLVTVDIKVNGTTILGANKLSIDANEKTSTTALTPTTLATNSIADDAEITIDVTSAGTGAAGLKVTLYYN
jgi:hypothetical protein